MAKQQAKAAGRNRAEDDDVEKKILAETEAAVIAELLEPVDKKFLGPKERIYYYRPTPDSCPAKDFLEDPKLPDTAKAAYAACFTRHCNGEVVRGKYHHVWEGYEKLWAYKNNSSQTRLMHTMERGNIRVLLFGFGGKKEDKVDQEQVNRAVRLQAEFQKRRDAIEARVRLKYGRGGRK